MDETGIKLLVEIIGTFLLIIIILRTNSDTNSSKVESSLIIAGTLFVIFYLGSRISGGHFNPAVTFSLFMKNNIELNILISYIIAQLIGGLLAVKFDNFILSRNF